VAHDWRLCTIDLDYYATNTLISSVKSTGIALAANPRPLRTDLSYPACIASGNFILEFLSKLAVSPILTVAHAREVCGADDKFGCRTCVNVMHAGQERSV